MKIQAKDLKAGMRFTFVGAFVEYWAGGDATEDLTYTGKVKLRGVRHSTTQPSVYLDIRLDADQEVEVTGKA